jgi:quercetin dioxygenase-like cupin family protein
MDMDIKRNGSRPSAKGSPDWFTGSVRVDPLFQAPDPARVGGGQVTFEPGARTAWHTHPLGQTLIITAVSAGCSARADPSKKSVRATWYGFRPA